MSIQEIIDQYSNKAMRKPIYDMDEVYWMCPNCAANLCDCEIDHTVEHWHGYGTKYIYKTCKHCKTKVFYNEADSTISRNVYRSSQSSDSIQKEYCPPKAYLWDLF